MSGSFPLKEPPISRGHIVSYTATHADGSVMTIPREDVRKTVTPNPAQPPAEAPFQNQKFKDFMRKLVAVPKAEIVEQKKYQRKKARRAKRK
jgi:hypothetical protein